MKKKIKDTCNYISINHYNYFNETLNLARSFCMVWIPFGRLQKICDKFMLLESFKHKKWKKHVIEIAYCMEENLDHWNPYDALLSQVFLLFWVVWNVHARTFIFPFHVWFLFHKRHIYKLIDNKKAGNLIFPANARSSKSHYIHACWEGKLCK